MQQDLDGLCQDINQISAYLAYDDFNGDGPGPVVLSGVGVIALLGNQVIATLASACALMQRSPAATLLVSGGVGHSTPLLYGNLLQSSFGGLVRHGLVKATMAEAEMYAAVAQCAFQIPANRILIENRSKNTAENARNGIQLLMGADRKPASILILQDPTMQRRSMLTWAREAEIAGSSARVFSHAVFVPEVAPGPDGLPRLAVGQETGTWTMDRFVALIMGEIRRLRDDQDGYGPKGQGFLPHVDIPEPVLESYQRLSASHWNALAIR